MFFVIYCEIIDSQKMARGPRGLSMQSCFGVCYMYTCIVRCQAENVARLVGDTFIINHMLI